MKLLCEIVLGQVALLAIVDEIATKLFQGSHIISLRLDC